MMRRREFIERAVGGLAYSLIPASPSASAAIIQPDNLRPRLDAGVAAGLSGPDRAIVWAHADRPSRLVVEFSTVESFAGARRVTGTVATPETGLTARALIGDFGAGQDVFYRAWFEDLANRRLTSPPEAGRLRSPRASGTAVRVVWTADVCGQGWGIDTARGGMQLFKTMSEANPDLFVHVGDTIYADGPLAAEVKLDDGTMWRNVVTPAKSKVAETLDEYRGNHLYNRLDEHYRRFSAQVAQVTMWDDHEVRDNWYHEQVLTDERYTERRVAILAQRARQAFLEHYPVTMDRSEAASIYQSIPAGPLVEVFALDMRSYRAANSANLQETAGRDTAFLGSRQVQWLADALARSKATWKIIAADMPLGVVVAHQPGRHEAVANADNGRARGRELEIAGLLGALKQRRVRNTVWITADVHYSAAHNYDPARAAAKDFDPFWEFIAGPAHAGTFAPATLDGTFGPEVRFHGTPANLAPNRPPDAGLQFFGMLEADPKTRALTVSIVNTAGQRVFTQQLEASA
jgi:alkaline phosphatase D